LPPPRQWHSRKLWLVSEVEAYLNEWPSEGQRQHHEAFSNRSFGEIEPSHSEVVNGPGGYPIVTDPTHPLKRHYDQLGFDPATMGETEMMQLRQEAEDRWRASIPGTPLGKREKKALAQLASHGSGVLVHRSEIKDCGSDTEERLKARGFIETRDHTKFPGQTESYILTAAGLEASENS